MQRKTQVGIMDIDFAFTSGVAKLVSFGRVTLCVGVESVLTVH
jgi:hypothetical protein